MLTAAAKEQMAELEARRAEQRQADRDAQRDLGLRQLRQFDHVFTSHKRVGQTVARNGLVVGQDSDAGTVTILELVPDGHEPCVACGRVPTPRRVETRTLTVAHDEITDVFRPEHAARAGWGLRLLGAVLDGNTIHTDRARRLLAWTCELARIEDRQ